MEVVQSLSGVFTAVKHLPVTEVYFRCSVQELSCGVIEPDDKPSNRLAIIIASIFLSDANGVAVKSGLKGPFI